jgi:hypothetical protein
MMEKKFDGSKICKICKKEKAHISDGSRHGTGWIWKDLSGRRWCGAICPSCLIVHHKSWPSYSSKHGTIDDVAYFRLKKGRIAERLVAKIFSDHHFVVTLTTLKGPDLIIRKYGVRFTVEVKNVTKHKRKRLYWFVSPISKMRKHDDLFAMLLPCGHVVIQPMTYHLSKCAPRGYRSVSDIVLACDECKNQVRSL